MKNRHRGSDAFLTDLRGSGPRVSSRVLPRRTVLRAAGLAVALPMLEAMVPSALAAVPAGRAASPSGSPKRLLYVYVPNGIHLEGWRQDIPAPPGESMP